MENSEVQKLSISREEKVMLTNAIGLITRNIEALLPDTMNWVLTVVFANDDPLLVHNGSMNRAMIAQELRIAADNIDPPVVKKDKK